MEKQQLPTVFDIFFVESFFDWVARVQNFLSRSISFVQSPILTTSNKAVALISSPSSDQTKLDKDGANLEHEIIEHVMERLGLGCHQESTEHSRLTFHDMKTIFDENEPCLAEVKAAFCVFDQNNDGFIDENEMKRVMLALGIKEAARSETCRMMIREYDQNGDGFIDFIEFVKVVEKSFYGKENY